jgi:tRNA A37 N6-isopentenylltransferase MiaA
MTFPFQHDIPGQQLPKEWRALLAKQTHTLELMLSRVADTVASVSANPQQERAQRLHDILNTTEQFLTTLAQQNIGIEQGQAVFQAIGAGPWPLPTETARRFHLIAQVNAIFHANLTATRRYLKDMRQTIEPTTTGA